MTRIWGAAIVLVAALALPVATLAHGGHLHKALGTIARIDGVHVDVKTTDGRAYSGLVVEDRPGHVVLLTAKNDRKLPWLMLIAFVVVNTALVVLKRRPGEPQGAFEVPVFVPVLGALVCLTLIVLRPRTGGWEIVQDASM